jgi:hypothetical protein
MAASLLKGPHIFLTAFLFRVFVFRAFVIDCLVESRKHEITKTRKWQPSLLKGPEFHCMVGRNLPAAACVLAGTEENPFLICRWSKFLFDY